MFENLINATSSTNQDVEAVRQSVFFAIDLLSPILMPIIAVGVFAITIRVIIKKIMEPKTAGSGLDTINTGKVYLKRKILIGFLISAFGAFMVWLSSQTPEIKDGFLLVPQALYYLIISNKALSALITALIGILMSVIKFF